MVHVCKGRRQSHSNHTPSKLICSSVFSHLSLFMVWLLHCVVFFVVYRLIYRFNKFIVANKTLILFRVIKTKQNLCVFFFLSQHITFLIAFAAISNRTMKTEPNAQYTVYSTQYMNMKSEHTFHNIYIYIYIRNHTVKLFVFESICVTKWCCAFEPLAKQSHSLKNGFHYKCALFRLVLFLVSQF